MRWCGDLTHPYFVNYQGIVSLVNIAEELGIKTFVRLTEFSVGYPVTDPVTVLFNLLFSLSKWHSRAEVFISHSSCIFVWA
jgi:hypothetical protein